MAWQGPFGCYHETTLMIKDCAGQNDLLRAFDRGPSLALANDGEDREHQACGNRLRKVETVLARGRESELQNGRPCLYQKQIGTYQRNDDDDGLLPSQVTDPRGFPASEAVVGADGS